jgi:hypothetical protein
MANDEAYLTDAFAQNLFSRVPQIPQTGARAFFNREGDCIEMLSSNESYYAERIDDLLTVFYGRDSKAIVGGVIKGAHAFVRRILTCSPGFASEFSGGSVRLEYLLTAALWQKSDDAVAVSIYLRLREIADQERLSVPMELETV